MLSGKICLVTGGGTGIGLATAKCLLKEGAKVIIASRKAETLEKAIASVKNPNLFACVVNIRDEESVKAAVSSIVEKHGGIDCLVNNGGGQFAAPAQHISGKGWRAVIDTNLNGTWNMTRAVFDATIPQRKNGRVLSIVNVTADNFTGFPGMAHTGAARAGVENLTKTLAREWGPLSVRINCVAPGIILSSGMSNYPDEIKPVFVASGSATPLGRCGTESEVAECITFLLSKKASYVTGATLRVDGAGSLSKPDLFQTKKKSNSVPAYHLDDAMEKEFVARSKL
jgi:NAD(P)-dependent dehydrogenase (short-subunit alcohol dehydrogenase family)